MKIKDIDKGTSVTIILAIYLFTIVLGLFIYYLCLGLDMSPLLAIFIADVVMTVFIFLIGLLIKNASLYDPYWSVLPAFLYVFWMITQGGINNLANSLILLVLLVWGIRLTYNWWKNWEGFSKQDWRYSLLEESNRKLYPITNLFGIHLIPTVVVFLQLINIFEIGRPSMNLGFFIGIAIAFIAPIIQLIADRQMFEFREKNYEKKAVIDQGLWKYSRHPNYFGELLFWVGIYIIYLSNAGQIDYHIIFPIAMISLFVFISIPMMEKKLNGRQGYQEYKQNVSMIIPFFRRKEEND